MAHVRKQQQGIPLRAEWESVTTLLHLERIPLEEQKCLLWVSHMPSPRKPMTLLQSDRAIEKRTMILQELLDNGSELTLILGYYLWFMSLKKDLWKSGDQRSFSTGISPWIQWVLQSIQCSLLQYQNGYWDVHTQQLTGSSYWFHGQWSQDNVIVNTTWKSRNWL